MMKWVYEIATGVFQYGGPYEPPVDLVTQGVVSVPRHPDVRTERYDGAGGIRAATEQEIVDGDAAQSLKADDARFNGDKLMKALVIWMAGKQGMTVQAARAEIIQVMRGL